MSHISRTVGTILLLAMLHVPAVWGDWYFFFWWYDVFMHGLGGFAAGCIAVLLWGAQKTPATWKSYGRHMLFVLGCTALIGIGWEWFEGIVDALFLAKKSAEPAQLGLVDTMLDLYFDLFGGLIAFFVAQYHEQKTKNI